MGVDLVVTTYPRPTRRIVGLGRKTFPDSDASASEPICPLCERPIPKGTKSSRHHLVPKLKGGSKGETVSLHQICHSAIHARFSEAELARRLNDIVSLRTEPALTDFFRWVRTKPAAFHAPTHRTNKRAGAIRDARRRNR